MKTLFLLLVLMAALIVPSQSQNEFEVSDAKMTAYGSKVALTFEDETTKAICINQTFSSGRKNVNYVIVIKNTGETKLTNIVLEDDLPTGAFYKGSDCVYLDYYVELTPSEIVRNRDGTTSHLIWELGELQTGEEKSILLSIDRKDGANDQDNAVMVTANALNPSEKNSFDQAAKMIAHLDVTDRVIKENLDENSTCENLTCKITVNNTGKTRLMDVVLKDTLPVNMEYVGSIYNESAGEETLPKPTIISHPNGTTMILSWFLGDFDSGGRKSIDLTLNCTGDSSFDREAWDAANDAKASSWTLVVSKIPIKITSGESQENEYSPVESKEPVASPGETESVTTPAETIV